LRNRNYLDADEPSPLLPIIEIVADDLMRLCQDSPADRAAMGRCFGRRHHPRPARGREAEA
jgi:hypothetical protein